MRTYFEIASNREWSICKLSPQLDKALLIQIQNGIGDCLSRLLSIASAGHHHNGHFALAGNPENMLIASSDTLKGWKIRFENDRNAYFRGNFESTQLIPLKRIGAGNVNNNVGGGKVPEGRIQLWGQQRQVFTIAHSAVQRHRPRNGLWKKNLLFS